MAFGIGKATFVVVDFCQLIVGIGIARRHLQYLLVGGSGRTAVAGVLAAFACRQQFLNPALACRGGSTRVLRRAVGILRA